MNLEFSFVTTSEKMAIMSSIPKKEEVEKIGNYIFSQRQFTDEESKETFYSELKKLVYNRSLGVPKKLKKFK
jgi:regulator of sirC expression with transglutaminase-like and TPR domain